MTDDDADRWFWGETAMLLRLRPPADPTPEQRATVQRALTLAVAAGIRFPDVRVHWRRGVDGIARGVASRDGAVLTMYLDVRLEGPALAAVAFHEFRHLDDFARGLLPDDRAAWERRACDFSEEMMAQW